MELSQEVIELGDLLEYYNLPNSSLNLTYLILARNKGIDIIKEMHYFNEQHKDLNKYEKQIKFRDYFYKISKEVYKWEEE